jgi:hypothetical protein
MEASYLFQFEIVDQPDKKVIVVPVKDKEPACTWFTIGNFNNMCLILFT